MITNKNLDHYCNNFYGYGKWESPYWIMGLEEAVGDCMDNIDQVIDVKINRFSKLGLTGIQLIDNHSFQTGIIDSKFGLLDRYLNPSLPNFKLQPYWKRGLQLIYGIENNFISVNDIGLLELASAIKDRLGSNILSLTNGISLIELYPLPLPKHNRADFNKFYTSPKKGHSFVNTGLLTSWKDYCEFVLNNRIPRVFEKIKLKHPKLILIMGKDQNYNHLTNLLSNYFNFSFNNFTVSKKKYSVGCINWNDNKSTIILHSNQPNGAWGNDYWNNILNQLKGELL
jgi:hypothetical protein